MKTIAGLFDSLDHAHAAVRALGDLGLAHSEISLVAHDASGEYGQALNRADWGKTTAPSAGAATGAVLGGLAGLLAGLGALVIPGIGPVLAAGPLGSALTGRVGSAVGAMGGGLLGALAGMGIPETKAQYYAEGVRRGGALVTVRVNDNMENQVQDVMRRHYAVDIERRAEDWRRRGWTGYNPRSEPYTAEQVAEERRAYNVASGAHALGNTALSSNPENASDIMESYRQHHRTIYGTTSHSFEAYRPAYEYGRSLRNDARYRGWGWDRLEPEARREWERRYPNSAWDEFKAAVRHAWEDVKEPAGGERR